VVGGAEAPLSGGQIQRLGLARAMFGMPKLVVLDEPNSNLDSDGDAALSQAITALRAAGSVVIVMAHRPSAIAAVNKVMILHSGQVARFGSKAEIMGPVASAQTPAAQPASNRPAVPDVVSFPRAHALKQAATETETKQAETVSESDVDPKFVSKRAKLFHMARNLELQA
jgi:ABC-type multidrug transport system ATPase subunit